MQKGDLVKVGLNEYDICTPFNHPTCSRVFATKVLSVSAYRAKRNGPAFTIMVDGTLKVVGMKRTDLYKVIEIPEYMLYRLGQ
jgi:hypothetical protein